MIIDKLRTNFIDAETTQKLYEVTDTTDGQVLVADVSEYTEFGSYFGAKEINTQHQTVNDLIDNQNFNQGLLDGIMDGTTVFDHVTTADLATNVTTATNADTCDTADTVSYAPKATTADLAEYADIADLADYVDYASRADEVAEIDYVTSADSATYATNAGTATRVTTATNAINATRAEHASTATSATTATNASEAERITGATINEVSFNGTANITIADNTKLLKNSSFILQSKTALEFTNNVCTISDSRITANSLAIVDFTSACLDSAKQAVITVETVSGAVKITAGRTPTETLYATIHIRVV